MARDRRRAAHLASAVIVAAAISAACGPASPTTPPAQAACSAGRVVILIYGTGSTGVFDPQDERALPDANGNPRPDVLDARLNKSFTDLTAPIQSCRIVTFSYDNRYLDPPTGTPPPGLLAWNKKDSPWDTDTETLATNLQRLMDRLDPSSTALKFDLIAYSAGGSVATYWAARPLTRPEQRDRVHSITVLDGIVSGVDFGAADIGCAAPGLRNHFWDGIGRFPCHFRVSDPSRIAVTGNWRSASPSPFPPLGTIRAQGDPVVWPKWAGLPGHAVADPLFLAELFCTSFEEFWDSMQRHDWAYCVVWKPHGTVLHHPIARDALEGMIRR